MKPLTWIFILALLFLIYICSSADRDSSTAPEVYRPDKMDAYVMAKQLMEKQLKAPATADFARFDESEVTNSGNDEWTVQSYVDSQNGFGALIRTRFTITMTVNRDTKYWQAIALKTKP